MRGVASTMTGPVERFDCCRDSYQEFSVEYPTRSKEEAVKKPLFGMAVILVIAGSLNAADSRPRTLSVAGTAEVTVQPDICRMDFSIVTQNIRSAIEAYRTNNEASAKVQAAVKSVGIEDKDVQTANFSMSPQYHWSDRAKRRILDGYTVTHTLTVSVRDLEKVSTVLDTAVTSGVTDVQRISFTVEDPKKHTAKVRIEAIKAAQEKAEAIAKEAGVKLLKPISINEVEPRTSQNYYNVPPSAMLITGAVDEEYGSAPERPELAPGETRLTHTVQIIYEIE